jgi:hypothetical protein
LWLIVISQVPSERVHSNAVGIKQDGLVVASVSRKNGTSMMSFAELGGNKGFQFARTAIAMSALLVVTGNFAEAGSRQNEKSIESVATRVADEPIMAIVSLRSQRITVYDADGWIMRAPISSGQAGRETPAGIFSVIQKDAEHHSNFMMMPTCPTCSDLRRRALLCTGGAPGTPGVARMYSPAV